MAARFPPGVSCLRCCSSSSRVAPGGPHAASAEEIGIVDQNDTIQGRDGGGSGLAWGEYVWVYGDTVLNDVDENGINWHGNSFSITSDTDASDGVGPFTEPGDSIGQPLELIAPTADELAFNLAHWGSEDDCAETPCGARWAVWPSEPFWDEAHQRALVTYTLIYAEPGDFNFEGVGGSIAVWSDPEARPERPVIDDDAEHPDLLWDADASWGATSRVEGDFFYTFACDGEWLEESCELARVPLDAIHDMRAWEYRTRNDWSAEPDDAVSLFDGANIMSLSWNEWLDAYLLVYADGGRVKARTAPEIWGEWSQEAVLYDAGRDDPYDVNHHAELEEDGGRVLYVTYSRSSGEGWFGTEFPIVRDRARAVSRRGTRVPGAASSSPWRPPSRAVASV